MRVSRLLDRIEWEEAKSKKGRRKDNDFNGPMDSFGEGVCGERRTTGRLLGLFFSSAFDRKEKGKERR